MSNRPEHDQSVMSFREPKFLLSCLDLTCKTCIVCHFMHPRRLAALFYFAAFTMGPFPFQAPAQSPIVINEIHYNPDVKTEPAEFIELYNAGTNVVNLGGWYFSNGIDYTFPAGTNLPPGGYVVVAQNPNFIFTKYGARALGPYTNNL